MLQVVQDGAFEHGYQQYLVNVPIQQLSDARSHVRRVSGHLAQVQSQNGGDEGVGGRAIELQQQLHMLSTDAEESRLHPLGRQLTVLFLPDMSTHEGVRHTSYRGLMRVLLQQLDHNAGQQSVMHVVVHHEYLQVRGNDGGKDLLILGVAFCQFEQQLQHYVGAILVGPAIAIGSDVAGQQANELQGHIAAQSDLNSGGDLTESSSEYNGQPNVLLPGVNCLITADHGGNSIYCGLKEGLPKLADADVQSDDFYQHILGVG